MDCAYQTFDSHYLHSQSNILIVGNTGSGKTWLATDLVGNFARSFPDAGKINKVVICFSSFQPAYERMTAAFDPDIIHLFNYFPADILGDEKFWSCEEGKENILVLDDLQGCFTNAKNLQVLEKLWTVMSHHCKITNICLLHDMFAKNLKMLKINTSYFFLLRGGMIGALFSTIQRFFFPNQQGIVSRAAKICYGDECGSRYLLVDCSTRNYGSPYQLRTGVLPSERGIGHAFMD